jgi:hypothetical protein
MVFDKREAILQQMLAVMGTVTGAASVNGVPSIFRNRGEVPTEKLPALVLLDGSEAIKISTAGRGGAMVPTIFTLKPQVFVVLKPRDDINNDGVGEELSDFRMKLLKAFTTDDNLMALLGSNGEINYLGHDTDMQTGSTMVGQMQMQFELTYVLDPRDVPTVTGGNGSDDQDAELREDGGIELREDGGAELRDST